MQHYHKNSEEHEESHLLCCFCSQGAAQVEFLYMLEVVASRAAATVQEMQKRRGSLWDQLIHD